MSEPTTKLLADWRKTFENRRTVPWEMMKTLEDIVDVALKTQRAEHEAEVARLQDTANVLADGLRRRDESLKEARSLNDDNEVQVTIDRRQGGWRLSDLEEVAYRLRCGGGTDDTPVEWDQYKIVARVVAPNLVPLSRPGDAPVPQADPPDWLPTWPQAGLILTAVVFVPIGIFFSLLFLVGLFT